MVNTKNANSNFVLPVALFNTSWKDGFTGTPYNFLQADITLGPYHYMILSK